jgi:hypothetical protein
MNGIPILNQRLQYIESLIASGAVPWDSSRLESSRHDRLTRPNHLHESICNPDSMDLDAIIENKLQRRMERFSEDESDGADVSDIHDVSFQSNDSTLVDVSQTKGIFI